MNLSLSSRKLSASEIALLGKILTQKKNRQVAILVTLMSINFQMQAFLQAFEEVLADKNYKFIAVIASWLSSFGLSNIEPDEIISEVWEQSVKKIYSGGMIQKPTNWIWKVARTVVYEKGRKHTRDRNKLVENFNLEERLCADPDTHDHEELNDTHIRVRHAFCNLGEDEQRILDMKFVQGFSWSAIGDFYGVTESTIRQRGCRALARLRKFYRQDHG
jgi:RNA polymerase sigma factor (sigma-70 family)